MLQLGLPRLKTAGAGDRRCCGFCPRAENYSLGLAKPVFKVLAPPRLIFCSIIPKDNISSSALKSWRQLSLVELGAERPLRWLSLHIDHLVKKLAAVEILSFPAPVYGKGDKAPGAEGSTEDQTQTKPPFSFPGQRRPGGLLSPGGFPGPFCRPRNRSAGKAGFQI